MIRCGCDHDVIAGGQVEQVQVLGVDGLSAGIDRVDDELSGYREVVRWRNGPGVQERLITTSTRSSTTARSTGEHRSHGSSPERSCWDVSEWRVHRCVYGRLKYGCLQGS
jgi:hypothetical protein